MVEELLSDPYALAAAGTVVLAGSTATAPLRKLGDNLASDYLNLYDREKEHMTERLDELNPSEDEFYELMGELSEEVSGCYCERASDLDIFDGKKDALLEYASSQEGENWRWLEERTDDIEFEDVL